MYTGFFGLRDKPFSITPDPRYLFMSERHAEAFAHLLYGINEAGGFVQLTGEIGTGKTTLVRSVFEKLPGHADVAVILNPRITPLELLLTICQELSVDVPDTAVHSVKALVDLLNDKLLDAHAAGRRVIVIIDEAQNLSAETLEQVRLLTNLETASTKLMQIILIGQPELREVLAHSGLKQLAQRITGRYHLAPLARTETAAYVLHRLRVAGATSDIFTDGALREIHRVSDGVPRLINVVCDRALLGAYTEDQHRIDRATVRRAASEVFGKSIVPRWIVWSAAAATAAAVAVLAIGVQQLLMGDADTAQAAAPTATASTLDSAPASSVSHTTPTHGLDIEALLTAAQDGNTIDNAFGKLLSLWGATYRSGDAQPCEQANRQGLQCVYQKGSWGQLRILNRPAILTLTDNTGNAHQVVLTALSDSTARIAFADAVHAVPLNALSRYWLGDYLLLWRPQAPGQRSLAVGMHGDEVRWLRRSLDRVQNKQDTSADDYYDEALAKRVEDFQRQCRLTVDGIAGVQTQIVLDSMVDASNTPRLLAAADTAADG